LTTTEITMRHMLPEERPLFKKVLDRGVVMGLLSCEMRVRWPDGSIH
jgi:hypothetical protein